MLYPYHGGNRAISSEQLFEATRAIFTAKDADGKLTLVPRSLPPLLTFILVPLIFLPVPTAAALLLVKDKSHSTFIVVFVCLVAAAVIVMQAAIQRTAHSNGAYVEIEDAAAIVTLPRAKREIRKEDVAAVRVYMTRIKTRPTNAFAYNLNVATLVARGEELDVIVYVRKASAAPCVAAAIAERIGCPLEMVDDFANADR